MRIVLTTSIPPVADYVAESLMARLAQGPVLWLLSGGSCIPVAVEAADRLRATGVSLTGLTVTLLDERYGASGHADSNWTQIMDAGFNLPGATLKPVLTSGSAEMAADHFAALLERHLGKSYCLALIGIGPDGHTSGIKPHSPAVTASGLVSAYSWDDFHRITTTGQALNHLDEAVVFALGEAKWSIIDDVEKQQRTAADQPAQFLSGIPELTIFTDRPGSRT